MKSHILHGEDHIQSRKRLSEIVDAAKELNWDIEQVNWKASKLVDLLTLSRSQNLLSLGQLIVVENFFASNKKAGEIIKELVRTPEAVFVFWEGKSINGNTLRSVSKNFVIQEFKIPVAIFNFLNSVYPGNTKNSLRELKNLNNSPAEFLLIMLARHIRQLIWVKEDPGSLKLQDWQIKNLARQADKFTIDSLLNIHARLLDLDRKNKKSQLPEDLSSSLDLVIASV